MCVYIYIYIYTHMYTKTPGNQTGTDFLFFGM